MNKRQKAEIILKIRLTAAFYAFSRLDRESCAQENKQKMVSK